MVAWTAVGALATVAGALFGYLELQDDEPPQSDDRKAADAKQDVKRSPAPQALPRSKILLRNKHSQLCADLVGTGPETHTNTPVQQWGCEETGDNQLWRLEKSGTRGPKGRPLFRIVNAVNGQCMDLPDFDGKDARTPVNEAPCTTTTDDNQLWWREKKEGAYWIHNIASENLCLDVSGIDEKFGDPLAIYHCIKGDDQAWAMANVMSKNS
jgi:hypothetical protein